MTREIKFRAWDADSSTMIYPGEFSHEEFYLECCDGTPFLMSAPNDDNDGFNHPEHRKESVIMQFAGFKDKKGKEIYESDIVRVWANPADYNGYEGHNYKGIIEWDDFSLGFILSDGHGLRDFDNIEILGNIFEDPELLEVENG